MNPQHPHAAGSYDPSYYGPAPHHHHYPYPTPPSHSHPYYSSGAPVPPHLHHGLSSDSTPYENTPHGLHPSSNQASSHTDQTTHSSSFESGSSNGGNGVTPYPGFHPGIHSHPGHPHPGDASAYHQSMMMGPPPVPPHGYPSYPWPPPAPIQYVNNIKPTDVLSGRGGATNSHSGNKAFRALVKQYQPRYLKAKKRDKPSVAVEVVQLIRKKGGRFLRRSEVPGGPHGEVLYYDIGDRRATEKACQALREGAPVLRAKRRSTTAPSEEDERGATSDSSPQDQSEGTRGASPSEEENKENGDNLDVRKESPKKQSAAIDNSYDREGPEPPAAFAGIHQQEPIFIRPCPRLMRRTRIEPISANNLSPELREIYLKDFLPPDPMMERNHYQKKPSPTMQPQGETQGGDPRNGWPVVGV